MISVVIPAYNEGYHLIDTLKKIPKEINQIVVVDDCSKDRTYELAREYSKIDSRILLLRNKKNMGKGYSVKRGVEHTEFENLIFIDASQFDPQDILKFKNLKKGQLLIGLRTFEKIPFHRKITNFLSNTAISLATSQKVSDCLSGFRAIKKSDFEKLNLKEDRYAVEPEMIYKAVKNGLRLYFIPIKIHYNNAPTSIMNFRSNWQIIKFLAKANLGMIK